MQENEYSPEILKQSGEIAANESAKRREQEATAERVAALEEKDASLQVIIPALIAGVANLERLLLEQKRPKTRVPKPLKKRRQRRRPGRLPEQPEG
jgi:hypothetical protein